jgi:predicted deacetylase
MYLIRLDDASPYMDLEKWTRIETLLDALGICPIVGVIPNCSDPQFTENYPRNDSFWNLALSWKTKGWSIALHGYDHCYISSEGGMNPVHKRSEFAGVPSEVQRQKIRDGMAVMRRHNLNPDAFFAPSHTFDENTLEALRSESDIQVIIDTVANDVYRENGFTFVPQQTGYVRKLPFKTITFCYHPNGLDEGSFLQLSRFLEKNRTRFARLSDITATNRKRSNLDRVLSFLYFARRKL